MPLLVVVFREAGDRVSLDPQVGKGVNAVFPVDHALSEFDVFRWQPRHSPFIFPLPTLPTVDSRGCTYNILRLFTTVS